MSIEAVKPAVAADDGYYYHLRIPQKQQYFFASIVESFSGLANHTTARDDKGVLIFFVSRWQVADFERLLKFLAGYENLE